VGDARPQRPPDRTVHPIGADQQVRRQLATIVLDHRTVPLDPRAPNADTGQLALFRHLRQQRGPQVVPVCDHGAVRVLGRDGVVVHAHDPPAAPVPQPARGAQPLPVDLCANRVQRAESIGPQRDRGPDNTELRRLLQHGDVPAPPVQPGRDGQPADAPTGH
jgi:hypothetical protein